VLCRLMYKFICICLIARAVEAAEVEVVARQYTRIIILG
jgi:hypothetical protein